MMHQESFDLEVDVTLPPHADHLCTRKNKAHQEPIETLIDLIWYAVQDDPYYQTVMKIRYDALPPEKQLTLRVRFETSKEIHVMRGSTASKHSPIGLVWWLADCHGMTFKEALEHYLYIAPEAMKRYRDAT